MDETMQQRIQKVLDGVKDPLSGLPVVELDLIERVRYIEITDELRIFTSFPRDQSGCMACVGMTSLVIDGIRRRLIDAFSAEFPDKKIRLAGGEDD